MKNRILAGILAAALFLSAGNSLAGQTGALEKARGLVADRHYEQAISLLKKELKSGPQSADLLVVMGDSYVALGKARKAEKYYRQALALTPGHPAGNLNLAMLLVAQRERNEGIALIKGVLADDPEHARAHFCLGMAYNARADINDAFAQYKILKKLDKALADELYNAIFSR